MFDSELKKFVRKVIMIIFGIIITVLTILSMFNTSIMDINEWSTIVGDNPFVILGWFIGVVFAIYFLRKRFNGESRIYFNKLFIIVSLVILIVGVFVIFRYDFYPVADQANVLNIASALKMGDFSAFNRLGYVGMCTNQAGIVMILYYLGLVFGDNNYQVIQVLNILALIGSIYCLCKITMISFKHNNELMNYTLLFLVLFFPLGFYITFVYGNLFGLFFSLFALLMGYDYFESGKYYYILFSIVGIMFAMIFKSNYLITFVAMLLFVLCDVVLNKRYISLLLVGVLVLGYFGSSWIPKQFVYKETGIELDAGIPMLAYVEMGLQDSQSGPGWFNGYNWNVYQSHGGDVEATNEQIKNDLSNTLSYYLSNPGEFMNFLYRKTVSQWCNGDFQCFWINRNVNFIENSFLNNYLNIFQSIVFLGTLAYIFFTGRHMKLHRLLLPTIFIGGFIFHLFWEAKGQYTITYFVLLIPYCVKGLIDMTNEINDNMLRIRYVKGFSNKLKLFFKMNTIRYFIIVFIVVFIIYKII